MPFGRVLEFQLVLVFSCFEDFVSNDSVPPVPLLFPSEYLSATECSIKIEWDVIKVDSLFLREEIAGVGDFQWKPLSFSDLRDRFD